MLRFGRVVIVLAGGVLAAGLLSGTAPPPPGPSFNAVAEGEVTHNTAGSSCTPQRFSARSTFVDTGHVVHTLRNEGTVPAMVYVTWLVAPGATVRVDEPSPGNCPF
jgi:hypothetical protein